MCIDKLEIKIKSTFLVTNVTNSVSIPLIFDRQTETRMYNCWWKYVCSDAQLQQFSKQFLTVLARSVHSARHRLLIWSSAAEVDHAPPVAVDFLQRRSASVH